MGTRVSGALSGILAALSLPPFDLWPLAFAALTPMALALSRPGLERRDVVACGLWFGALFYGVVLHWVPFTVHELIPLGALVGSLSVILLASTCAVQAIVLRYIMVQRSRVPSLAIPAVWVTTEMFLAHTGPLAMPWAPLGLALAAVPTLAGSAEWVGVHGLSLWIALVNGCAVDAVLSRRRNRRAGMAIITVLVALAPALAGAVRANTLPTYELPPVLITQIDIPRKALLDPGLRDERAAESLTAILASWVTTPDGVVEAPGRPVVAILPEAPFSDTWSRGVADRMGRLARELGFPILVGAHVSAEYAPDGEDREGLRNAIMLVEPAGTNRLVHAKARLVPGVERPGLLPGPRGAVLRIGTLDLGLAVCFESAFGGDVRRLRRDGAELLANPDQ